MSREHEHTLNVSLARLFRDAGMSARGEVQRDVPNQEHGKRARIDVEVKIGPATVAVEAEHGQTTDKRRLAIGDADRRILQGVAECAVAVCYPDDTNENTLPNAEFMWTVRERVGDKENWVKGSLDQLAFVVRLTPSQLGNPDYMAGSLSVSLDAAVAKLNASQKQQLSRKMQLAAPKRSNGRGLNWDIPAKRVMLVVATAVMFHSRLDEHADSIRPDIDNRVPGEARFDDDWPPRPAHLCFEADDPIRAFLDAWNLFLASDYTPIFRTARAALNACPPRPELSEALRITAEAALKVVQNIAGLRHDLLGRIFHTVLDTARNDGSFYTTTAAATILATLAITDEMCDWSDPNAVAKLRITDPACGTGTLLMASAERIRELMPQEMNGELDRKVAKSLIEEVLTGFDVNLTATHMAATTLGLLSPTTQFQHMKIGQTFLGVDKEDGKAYLGSLEFLDVQPKLMPWPNGNGRAQQVESGEEFATVDPSDVVIMNPPFTQHDLRHQQFDASVKDALKAREKRLLGNTPVNLTSNSNSFVVLAEYLNKPDQGTFAAILPLATATHGTALDMRKFLARSYHVEFIVVPHDPDRIFFSENTTISEMLIVCRRWPDRESEKPPTRFVNLARNPSAPSDAIAIAWSIKDDKIQSRGYGTSASWSSERVGSGDWSAVQFLSPFLVDRFTATREGELFRVTELGRFADWGSANIRTTFNRSDFPGQEGMTALWDHKTDVITTMRATTDAHILPKAGMQERAEKIWEGRGRLMLPTRLHLSTTRAVSVILDSRALGSAWVPCNPSIKRIDTIQLEQALSVYMNSTIGLLAFLGGRSNKTLTYPQFSMYNLRRLPVPDFTRLDGSVVELLAEAFNRTAASELKPLPHMDSCETRAELDEAVCDALELDPEMIDNIRRSLAQEPSITGRRFQGMSG